MLKNTIAGIPDPTLLRAALTGKGGPSLRDVQDQFERIVDGMEMGASPAQLVDKLATVEPLVRLTPHELAAVKSYAHEAFVAAVRPTECQGQIRALGQRLFAQLDELIGHGTDTVDMAEVQAAARDLHAAMAALPRRIWLWDPR